MHLSDLIIPENGVSSYTSPNELTKRNLLCISYALREDTRDYPEPKMLNVKEEIVDKLPYGTLSSFDKDGRFGCILISYMLSNGDDKPLTLRRQSDVAHLCACNNFRIECFGYSQFAIDTLKRLDFTQQLSELGVATIQEFGDSTGFSFVKEERSELLPESLREHLREFGSESTIAREICRLQMLSPESMRAKDPLKALINAWNIINR